MRTQLFMKSMEKASLDAFIISRESNIYYYTGTISGGVLLLTRNIEPILFVPSLNIAIARDQASGCEAKPYSRSNPLEQLEGILKNGSLHSVGFDDLTLDLYRELQKRLPHVELKPSADMVWEMRRVKDAKEQKLLRRAGKLADIGMEAVRERLKVGLREYEVAAEAAYAMMRNGSEDNAFSAIVASGPRSAYPHAGVTGRRIRKGDFVTIDIGATFKGYRSDLTRTFIVGSPIEKQTDVYEAVLRANEAALPWIREGAKGSDVDEIARAVIKEAGYGENFVHSLGHGVGLEVHEPPSLSETSQDILKAGNVVTDEPGVYMPGFGGVRIEDTVLITEFGPERLTTFDKGLDDMRV